MSNVYVEARPLGKKEGERIDDYVVEEVNDRILHTTDTQAKAIKWAKSKGYTPHVARVRHLNNKRNPDHWRAV